MTKAQGPLSGTRVIDFTWAAMGPYAGYLLASLGAEVIQISRPTKGKTLSAAQITEYFNIGKICFQLDVKSDEGKNILAGLVEKSDIFLENFRPGVIEDLGFGIEDLVKMNSEIVMVSGSALGRGAADSQFIGYAPIFSALSGLADLTGFEDGPPTEIRYPCDLTSGALMAFAAISGLIAARNGNALAVDLSARDALLWTLSPSLGAWANGKKTRIGNAHSVAALQDVYRCADDDGWIAVTIPNFLGRETFLALIDVTLSGDQTFTPSTTELLQVHDALAAWARRRSAAEAAEALRSAGIAASKSNDSEDLWLDEQLRARDFYRYVDGAGWTVASPWVFGGDRSVSHAPLRDNGARNHVLANILGYDTGRIDHLFESGIVG